MFESVEVPTDIEDEEMVNSDANDDVGSAVCDSEYEEIEESEGVDDEIDDIEPDEDKVDDIAADEDDDLEGGHRGRTKVRLPTRKEVTAGKRKAAISGNDRCVCSCATKCSITMSHFN